MSDWADERAAEVLPCRGPNYDVKCPNERCHSVACPAEYRPAVAEAIRVAVEKAEQEQKISEGRVAALLPMLGDADRALAKAERERDEALEDAHRRAHEIERLERERDAAREAGAALLHACDDLSDSRMIEADAACLRWLDARRNLKAALSGKEEATKERGEPGESHGSEQPLSGCARGAIFARASTTAPAGPEERLVKILDEHLLQFSPEKQRELVEHASAVVAERIRLLGGKEEA